MEYLTIKLATSLKSIVIDHYVDCFFLQPNPSEIMKRIIVIVVMGVLFLALYGFKLHLPTPNGTFEINTGLKKPPVKAAEVEEES